jgi:hypothetical protein
MVRADNLITLKCRLPWILGASTSWNPQGLSRAVLRLLYIYIMSKVLNLQVIRYKSIPSYTVLKIYKYLMNTLYNLSQWPTWFTNFNKFITILYMYMFRTISCSSSGGQIALIQHLVSSLSVSDRPVHRLRENCSSLWRMWKKCWIAFWMYLANKFHNKTTLIHSQKT